MKRFSLITYALINIAPPAAAKDFGVHGHTFEVLELDLLKQIEHKLKVLEKNGTLAKTNNELLQKAKKTVMSPKSVEGITKATQDRTFTYDPSILVPYDLKDHEGRVFHKAGTRVNPLEHRVLSSTLLFLDGGDPAQVTWAESLQAAGSTKVILTSGSPFELMEKWKHPVYFDQGGTITKKLGIQHVPALVVQDGLKLKVSEILLQEDSK